jgi:hypothetical protein
MDRSFFNVSLESLCLEAEKLYPRQSKLNASPELFDGFFWR